MKPFIETFTGETFSPLRPDPAMINIKDIAHALANQARFAGHSRFRYSVAEHSVRVSELITDWGYPTWHALWGLLHDASEAYLIDLPTPLKMTKALGEPYRRVEECLMREIVRRFGLRPESEPQCVREADESLLATEVRDLMHGERSYWKKINAKPIPDRIRPWSADVAEFEFIRRFHLLGGANERSSLY